MERKAEMDSREGGREPARPDLEPAGPPAPPQATWRAIEAIPVFVIVQVATAIVVSVILAASDSCSLLAVVGQVTLEFAFLLTVVGWIRYVNHGRLAALGAPRKPLRDVAAGLGTGVGLVLLGTIAYVLVRAVARMILGHEPVAPQQVAACVQGWSLVWLAPVTVLLAPVGEEVFFRGFLYKGLRRRFSVWPSIAFSSFLFGLGHLATLAFAVLTVPLMVVGAGLAWVYERRQSLLASIAAHVTFNVFGYLAIALARR